MHEGKGNSFELMIGDFAEEREKRSSNYPSLSPSLSVAPSAVRVFIARIFILKRLVSTDATNVTSHGGLPIVRVDGPVPSCELRMCLLQFPYVRAAAERACEISDYREKGQGRGQKRKKIETARPHPAFLLRWTRGQLRPAVSRRAHNARIRASTRGIPY